MHGVGISDFLMRLDIHNQDKETLPQRRKIIIEEITNKIGHKGIWAYDRGNDSGDFFRYLNRDFQASLKSKACQKIHLDPAFKNLWRKKKFITLFHQNCS